MGKSIGIAAVLIAVLSACGGDDDGEGDLRACGDAVCAQGSVCCDHCTGACVPENSGAFCPDDNDPGRDCDAVSDPDAIACAGAPCDRASEICCLGTDDGQDECLASDSGDCAMGWALRCDEAADCGGADVCCVLLGAGPGNPGSASCDATCGPSGIQLCQTDDECENGGPCATRTCSGVEVNVCGAPDGCG
jgi:hypothetical protein